MIVQVDPQVIFWALMGVCYAAALGFAIKGGALFAGVVARRADLKLLNQQLAELTKVSEKCSEEAKSAATSVQQAKQNVQDAVNLAKRSKVVIIEVGDATHVLCQAGKVVHLKEGGKA